MIFDLFGTMVGSYSTRENEAAPTLMANALGAPREEFARLWNDETWPDRAPTGLLLAPSGYDFLKSDGNGPGFALVDLSTGDVLMFTRRMAARSLAISSPVLKGLVR